MVTLKRKYYSVTGLQSKNLLFTPAFIDIDAQANYNRIIADGGVSDINRLNYFIRGLKAIYGDLANVPVCYDAHWIGYKLGSGTGATLGKAAAKLYSLTVAGDAVQSTAASQPLLLSHNGASSDNYLYAGPGSDVAGAYCQTSTNVSPQVNTNFTFEFNFKDFNSRGILGGCPAGSSDGWSLQIQGGTNLLRLYVRNLSVNTSIDSTTAITVTGNRWVKVVRSGNDYSFFEKVDGGTYTQVGTTITNSVVLNSYNLPIQIGSGFGTNYASIGCKILRARFYNDATATNLVADFNPATYNASTSQTAWTSATGEIWTINTGTATTGYKGCLVDRSIVMYDRTDDSLLASNNATLNTVLGTDHCSVLVATRYSTTNTEFLIQVGGDFPNANATQWWTTSSPNFYRSNNGSIVKSQLTLNTYTIAKAFSYADSIIFGGTSVQVINASSESGSFFNNTTNKPIPNTGLLLGRSAGIGSFNGIISTIIIGNDPTKYLLTKELARSLNNNFAL